MKVYKQLDIIPIFNYYKASNDKDLRYLICNVDINDLPEVTEKEKEVLFTAYIDLLKQRNDIDTSLQDAFIEAQESYLLYLKNEEKEQKMHNKFGNYLVLLDNYFNEYKYKDQVYNSAKIYYKNYKVGKEYHEYIHDRYKDFYYENFEQKSQKVKIWDLDEDIIFIQQFTQIKIDKFKDSANYYLKLKKQAINRAKQQKSKQKK